MKKSISQYKSELDKLAQSYGLKGVVTDYMTSILAYAIYEQSLNQQVIANELNPDTASNINSKIGYALRHLYSVFRGHNARVTLNITTVLSKSYKRGDILFQGSGWELDVVNSK